MCGHELQSSPHWLKAGASGLWRAASAATWHQLDEAESPFFGMTWHISEGQAKPVHCTGTRAADDRPGRDSPTSTLTHRGTPTYALPHTSNCTCRVINASTLADPHRVPKRGWTHNLCDTAMLACCACQPHRHAAQSPLCDQAAHRSHCGRIQQDLVHVQPHPQRLGCLPGLLVGQLQLQGLPTASLLLRARKHMRASVRAWCFDSVVTMCSVAKQKDWSQ